MVRDFRWVEWPVTDQGAHFKNELIRNLSKELWAKHHFTTAYSTLANGTLERVCREVLRACKALLHEFRLAPKDWPAVTEFLQSVIDHTPSIRLELRDPADPGVYRTPQAVVTSHKLTRPFLSNLPVAKFSELPGLTDIRPRQVIGIEATKAPLENMHRDIAGRIATSRAKAVLRHYARTNF